MDVEKAKYYQDYIAQLPQGNITYKKINGKIYTYYQWTENGKQRSRVVKPEEFEELKDKIEQRKALEKELKEANVPILVEEYQYFSSVLVGKELKEYVDPIKDFKKRECYKEIQEYVYGKSIDKVLILYGLRRTGKTTLIKQIICNMDQSMFYETAFVKMNSSINLAKIHLDLKNLTKKGYKYIFIDEVTLMEDFIEGAALFSDIYAARGIKIVLSGTDSLGFLFSEDRELFDRCFMIHTTFIPYREFTNVLGINGIDNYIKYGGTMSLSGNNYNFPASFKNEQTTNEYIDSAIANNIQHSLKNYQNGNHFRKLYDLYEANELTSVINRVVEYENKKFTIDVLTKTFVSSDFSLTAKNLIKDRNNPTNILYLVDKEKITEWFRKELNILNKPEMKVEITNAHVNEIKEYLKLLDLIIDIDVINMSNLDDREFQTVISQPGMRYAQAKALVEALVKDKLFQTISVKDRSFVTDKMLSTIEGKIMEDIILLETKMAKPNCEIFKIKFAVGEFDMVIFNPQTLSCEIFEIKHSKEVHPEQYRHLIDEQKLKETEFRYGDITRRCVIYNGESHIENDVEYLNVEEYLKF